MKSIVGLGSVYFAMFGPALQSSDLNAARLCGEAVKARLLPSEALRDHFTVAGCALAIATQSEQRETSNVAIVAAAPRVREKIGSLTEADLREPWYGPTERARKARPLG